MPQYNGYDSCEHTDEVTFYGNVEDDCPSVKYVNHEELCIDGDYRSDSLRAMYPRLATITVTVST